MKFTIYDMHSGRVAFGGQGSDPGLLVQVGQAMLEDEVYSTGWIDNGVHFEQPAQPSPHHVFDWISKTWNDPRTLQDLKDAQWTAIKQARSAAEYAGFSWDGSVFDSDAISQNRITGAVTLATLSASFSIGWTLKDNTVRTLSAQEMCAVGAALGTHVAMQFYKAQGLRAQIESAADPAALALIVW